MADNDKEVIIKIKSEYDSKGNIDAEKGLKNIEKQTKKTTETAKKGAEETGNSFSSLAKKLLGVGSAILAIKSTFSFFAESINAYTENARAVNTLAAAYKAVGYDIKGALTQAQEFASKMQSLTGIADEAFLNAQRLLANYGVVGVKAQEAIQSAYALSVGKNMDFSASLDLVARAAAGQTQTLSRYGIILGDNVKEGEKFEAVLSKINELFGATAQATMNDTITKTRALKEEWGDFKELLGKELEPVFLKVLDYARELVKDLGTLFGRTDEQKKYQQNLERIAQLQKEINEEDTKALKYEIEHSQKLGEINWKIVNEKQVARYEEIKALQKENEEIEKQKYEEMQTAKIEKERASLQEQKINAQRVERTQQEEIKKAVEKTKKAQEESIQKQRKILDNLGLSTSKDLRGWGRASQNAETAPTNLEIASGGESPLASAEDSITRYNAEREALALLYDEKRAYIEQEITDETLRQEALNNLQTQYNEQVLTNDRNQAKARQQVYSSMWGALTNLANSSNKKVAAIGKVASVAQATMSMFTGAAKALELPFPANLAAVATVLAQGAMLVEQIEAVKLAKGGLVKAVSGGVNTIIGEGGSDEAVLPLDNARAMQRIGGAIAEQGGAVGGNVVININVQASGGVEAILEQLTDASRSGVVQALEFANLNYKVGAEQQGLSI